MSAGAAAAAKSKLERGDWYLPFKW